MAHSNFDQLEILLRALDDYRNDIFLHVDKKVEYYPEEELESICRYSKLYIVNRINVTWGAFSQIQAEMALIENAVSTADYSYLHLLSGADFPIKNQDYIHTFFMKNKGKEFIDLANPGSEYIDRCKYYWFFREKLGRKGATGKNNFGLAFISKIALYVQKIIKLNRIPKDVVIKKGANWFSITGDFAKYVVDNKHNWEKMFRHTLCADELFIQTIFVNSPFSPNLYNGSNSILRLIDWKRGNPYIFRFENLEELKKSDCIIARKFDITVDSKIIMCLAQMLGE